MSAELQDRLRLVVDAIPALVSYVDAGHCYRLVNAAYEQWFGRPKAEVEGRHLQEVLGEAAYRAVLPFIHRALAGETLSYETVAPYRHGGTRHIHASYAPHRDADGRVVGFVALGEDITARKRAEEELASVRAETSKILASVTEAFCAFDRQFRYTYLNQQAEQYLGRPKEALLGRVLWEAFPQTEGTASLEHLRSAMVQREAQHFEMLSAITGRWIEVDAYPYEDGLALLFPDVTERKEAEAALRESEERLPAALKSAPIAVFNQDLDLRYTWVHDTGLRIAGSVLGRTDAELWERPEEREALRRIKQRVLESGAPDRQEVVLHIGGERRVYDLTLEPLRDGEGQVVGLIGAAVDVTERKQIEERLRQSAKMEAIGRLAGGLAHDFNNQLHALSGFAEFVARDPGLGPRARRDLLEIQRIAERMGGLTRQLLAFSRQQVLVPETLDLNTAVGEAQGLPQRLIGRSIEMALHPAPAPVWVRVDRSQLLQVLMNLAINGRDAMPGGGALVIRTGYCEIERGEPDPNADGGAPIPPGRYAALPVTDAVRASRRSTCPTSSSRSSPPRRSGRAPAWGSPPSTGS